MSGKRTRRRDGGRTVRVTPPLRGRVNRAFLAAQSEEEIARIAESEEAPPAEFWEDAVWVPPKIKSPISIRVDEDVLRWFKRQGKGYQTRMNAVLRAYMEHRKR